MFRLVSQGPRPFHERESQKKPTGPLCLSNTQLMLTLAPSKHHLALKQFMKDFGKAPNYLWQAAVPRIEQAGR